MPHPGYVIARLLNLVLVLLAVNAATFLLARRMGGDPVQIMSAVAPTAFDAEERAVRRSAAGLDQPLVRQYLANLRGLATGDLGLSLVSGKPVARLIAAALPVSLILAVSAAALAMVLGLSLGMLAAAGPRPLARLAVLTSSLLGALPTAGAGVLLIWIFAARWHLLPAFGLAAGPGVNYTDLAGHLVLPALALSLHPAALFASALQESLAWTLGEDYIRTAAAKGQRPWIILSRHALHASLAPVVSLAALQFGAYLGGAAVVEKIFALPGLGALLTDAVARRDYPVIQGTVLYAAAAFFLATAGAGVLQAQLDPRLRQERPPEEIAA